MKVFLAVLLVASFVHAADVLTSIEAIRSLTPEQASEGRQVRVEATATLYNAENEDLIIHDGVAGMFVLRPALPPGVPRVMPGDRLRVEGITFFGGFIPSIMNARVTILGSGPVPEPLPIKAENFFSPELNLQWVEMPAVIVGVENDGPFFTMIAEVDGWTIPVMLPRRQDDSLHANALMQQSVRIRGVVGTNFNNHGQMTGRLLYVSSFNDISPTQRDTTVEPVPLLQIDHLLRSDTTLHSPVRLRGVITGVTQDGFYMRGEGGSLFVYTANADGFTLGDEVEAEGFAAVAPFRPVLHASRVKKMGNRAVAGAPQELLPDDDLAEQQAELVYVTAKLLAIRNAEDGFVLQCRAGNRFFEASLPRPNTLPPNLTPNAELRLTGICELEPSRSEITFQSISRVRLRLRSANDITIVRPAPWLTVRRMLWIAGILAIIAFGAFTWAALLRRRVAAQTRIISEKIRREAVQNERQRLAREMHDTIEQHLASLAIQLGTTQDKLNRDPQAVGPALDLTQRMLRYCRQEARTSIWDLRSVALEHGGLEGAFSEMLTPVAQECGARFSFQVEGDASFIHEPFETHLLRIAHEAVANAARHGKANHINVQLFCSEEKIALEITDDGCGFRCDGPVPRGHFGLQGMRERADKMGGILSVRSAPGNGTTISLTVPRKAMIPNSFT